MKRLSQRGFTLLELLVVLVIVGIMLGFVTLNAMPSGRQALQNEAQRIALLLQLARDEAIVRNRPVAFEVDQYRYRFWILDENNVWQTIDKDDMLREREFQRFPVNLAIDPPMMGQNNNTLRIVFGREPVDKPFVLSLSVGDSTVAIRADGIGNFTVD
jgi:general secretion pathway protein H